MDTSLPTALFTELGHGQVSSIGAAALLIALVNEIMGNQDQFSASVAWSGVE